MPLRIRYVPFQALRRRPLGTAVLSLAAAGCLAAALVATAAPRLQVALEEQYALVAERPYDASVQNDLGNLLLLAGREEAAEQAYKRALEIDGSHAGARFNLGLLEQQNGRHEEALEHFETLLEIHPENAWAHYQSGVSLQELDRRKDAQEQYARAFGLDPTLSFAENNPHIIDNTMVTEALLMSSRYSTTAARSVARQYDDAGRIANLMLEPDSLGEEDETGTMVDDDKKMAKEDMKRGTPVQRAPSGGSPGGVDLSGSGEDLVEDRIAEDDESRVITEDDLDAGVQVGGAVDDPSTTRSRRDLRGTPRRSSGVDLRSNTRRNDQAPSRDLGGQRYRPSRRSSASLDLKLLPEEGSGQGVQEAIG